MNSTEQAHPAWIGVGVVHDTSRSLCGEAIRPFRAMLDRVASPTAIPSDSRLEARIALIFMIPGHILADPGFEGMRTSSYAREHHTKQMQIAVPSTLSKPDELRAFLGWCLETAPPLVEKALKRQRVGASLKCATQAAARARDHLDEVVEAAETAFAPWRTP